MWCRFPALKVTDLKTEEERRNRQFAKNDLELREEHHNCLSVKKETCGFVTQKLAILRSFQQLKLWAVGPGRYVSSHLLYFTSAEADEPRAKPAFLSNTNLPLG
jgi:hypothetical protein